MRFGLFSLLDLPPQMDSEKAYMRALEYFCYGEELGFEDAWVAEHHFSTYGTCGSPATFLCALAARTTQMRLAPAVSILPLHHPMQLAEDYAMVDVVSGGRLDFGVGRGYQPMELRGFGVEPSETRSRFEEALEIVEAAWTGEEVDFDGNWYRVEQRRSYPRPVQQPAPPIFIASISPETFDLVKARPSRYGIAASLLTSGYPSVREGLERFVESVEGHDKRMISLLLPAFVGATDEEALETVLRHLSHFFDKIKHLLPGSMGEPIDDSYAAYRGMAEIADHADIARFVRRCPVGSPDTAVQRLLDLLRDLPANQIIFAMDTGGIPLPKLRASMERMAEEVLPVVRRELETRPSTPEVVMSP